ncbi:DUF6884 domain-containing protein [Streptomyces sp. INA 01156]
MSATRLVVIPCAARKLGHPAPAGELYVGSYHRACRAAADQLTTSGGTVLILSGRYGLVPPSMVLQPYDTRIGDARSVSTDKLREQAGELGVDQAQDVTVLAGRVYAEACRPFGLTRGRRWSAWASAASFSGWPSSVTAEADPRAPPLTWAYLPIP